MNRLADKIAIVTGGAMGIGLATALTFAAEGAQVVIADLTKPELEEDHPSISYAELDVTDEVAWTRLVDEVVGDFGRLDVLVNNAGVIDYADLADVTPEDWARSSASTRPASSSACAPRLRPMLEQRSGSIINLSSAWGVVGAEGVAPTRPPREPSAGSPATLPSPTPRRGSGSTPSSPAG